MFLCVSVHPICVKKIYKYADETKKDVFLQINQLVDETTCGWNTDIQWLWTEKLEHKLSLTKINSHRTNNVH